MTGGSMGSTARSGVVSCRSAGRSAAAAGVYVCNGHLQNYRTRGGGDVERWRERAGPLRDQRRGRPRYRLTIGGSLELELRYALQCWHDGWHTVVLRSDRWGYLLHCLGLAGVDSVLDLDSARIRTEFGNRGEASFVRRVIDRFRRAALGSG